MAPSKSFVFKQIPKGAPVAGQDIATEVREVDIETPPKGGLILENLYASFDPYMRGRMRSSEIKSYSAAFELNSTIVNSVVGKVLKSDSPDYKQGDIVKAFTSIAQYSRINDPAKEQVVKINNPHNLDLATFLGPLGMPGLTAYSGMYEIGKPKKGETVFISSAAGAVGQVVGHIAKHEGLTVIGSVGSDEKLNFITKELGFDKGFNYKKESPDDALARLAPNGIDIYFENVGGEHLEAAIKHMNVGGRVPVCGMISTYNKDASEHPGIKNLMQLVAKQLTLQGFLVATPNFGQKYYKEHQQRIQEWLSKDEFKAKLFITEGIDNAADGFIGMLEGKNFGKAVLKI